MNTSTMPRRGEIRATVYGHDGFIGRQAGGYYYRRPGESGGRFLCHESWPIERVRSLHMVKIDDALSSLELQGILDSGD
jgi:hypothetical protein